MEELSAIPQASREIALQRFELLRPYLEGARPLRDVASEGSIPYRTALRWVVGYRNDGLAALARKGRTDQGGRRLVSTTLIQAIEGLALERPPLPISSIHRQAGAMAETLQERKPSYAVVRRIVRSLPASILMLAHRGNKAYGEGFDLVHRREALKPNSVWQVDHAQLDIKLLRDDGSTGKPWLTIVIDDYSRAVAGYYLRFEPPSSLRTTLALRQGIWRKGDPHWEICGIPDVLYTDNGSDFRSKHLEQVAADLKIRLVFSMPGQPQGRGRIERFFRTVNEMFLCDLDGYTARSGRKPTLTLDSLEKQFHTFLLEAYHRRPSSEGKPSPKERWEQGGFLPRMPDSVERLDLLLIHEVRTRKVRTDGIHFHNFRYLSLTLAAYVGEDVTIRFDPRDMGEVRVFYRDRFLCRAISADLAGQTVPLREIVNARKRRREQLRTIVKDRLKTVDTLLEFKRGRTFMQARSYQSNTSAPSLNATSTSSELPVFVETLEYKRFVEFCEACRRDRYIGLCYGPPGVGKTLSAIHHSRVQKIVPLDRWNAEASDAKPIDTVLFTPEVVNTPARIENDVRQARSLICSVAKRATRAEQRATLDVLRSRDEAWRVEHRDDRDYRPNQPLPLKPTYYDTLHEYEARLEAIPDPTTLIVVDEADRLAMNSLEQLRSIFDQSGLGMVLIGMPGIEKRLARYPQFFSRIGFVHEFRTLSDADLQVLLEQRWAPPGIHLPCTPPEPEVIAAVIRLTRGNFRLLVRLLTQMERVLTINSLKTLSVDVVETARENLVIGQA